MESDNDTVLITITVNNRGRISTVDIPWNGSNTGHFDLKGDVRDALSAMKAISLIAEYADVEQVTDLSTGEVYDTFDDLGNPIRRDPLGR